MPPQMKKPPRVGGKGDFRGSADRTSKKQKAGGMDTVDPSKGKSLGVNRGGRPDPNYDMTHPGAGEKAYEQNKDTFFSPGQAQGYYDQTKGSYTTPGQGERVGSEVSQDFQRGSQGSSAGQDYWEGVSGRYGSRGGPGYVQDTMKDPGLDQYYDAAFTKGQRRIDRAAAARGGFNSSEALRNSRDFAVNLGAEQANREADYRLRQAQAASEDERAWMGSMGDLAFGAGKERLEYGKAAADTAASVQEQEQSRLVTGYNAAMGIDQNNVMMVQAGLEAANAAQDQREGRIQQQFNNTMAVGDRVYGGYGAALAQDAAYAQQQIGSQMGQANDAYNQSYANQQQQQARQDAYTNMGMQFMSNYPWGGQGGNSGGGGKKAP